MENHQRRFVAGAQYERPHFALGTKAHRTIQHDIERLRQNCGASLLRALNHGSRQTIVGADTVQRYVEQVSGDASPAQSEFFTQMFAKPYNLEGVFRLEQQSKEQDIKCRMALETGEEKLIRHVTHRKR